MMTTLRKAIRRPRVLEATGWSIPTLYRKMNVEKVFPKAHRLDPNGQAVVWWEDEVIAWQRGEWKPAAEVAV
jgi:predicted DNA-binding transcriptional regulator AlpA